MFFYQTCVHSSAVMSFHPSILTRQVVQGHVSEFLSQSPLLWIQLGQLPLELLNKRKCIIATRNASWEENIWESIDVFSLSEAMNKANYRELSEEDNFLVFSHHYEVHTLSLHNVMAVG